jgi:hypothetical protein
MSAGAEVRFPIAARDGKQRFFCSYRDWKRELARKLAELGASREQVLAFLRKFKVEDNYIAQAMRYVSRTKPMENPRTSMPEADAENGVPNEVRLDFSKYRKVRKPLRGVKG